MALLRFGKKKKTEDPVPEAQNECKNEEPLSSGGSDAVPDDDELGQLYSMGLECQDNGDDSAAFQYLKKAAENGHVLAQFTLGTIYERGNSAVYPDINEAIRWYNAAAQQGDPGAQFNLGYMYLQDPGSQDEGIAWIRKAAEQGDEAAQEYLSLLSSENERKQKMTLQREKNKALAKKAFGRKSLFVIRCGSTGRVFILEEGDYYALIFDDEQLAREQCVRLAEEGYSCGVSQFAKKDFMAVFGSFFRLGCNAVRFDAFGEQFDVYLYDIIKITRKNNSAKKLIENPKLVRSMLLFRQESAKKAMNTEPDETMIRRYQSEISHLLYQKKAELILPYLLIDKDGIKVRTPIVMQRETEENPPRAVLFSGEDTFSMFKKDNPQVRRRIVTAGELAQIDLLEGVGSFIVDPDSAKLLINVVRKKQ